MRNYQAMLRIQHNFLKRLESLKHNLPENTILFCMDVKSLYPSVPRKETLEACQKALDNRLDKSIPTAEVLNMINIVLENSYFTFVDKNYKQNDGTAIGSKLGMHFASTYMGKWEEQLLRKSEREPLEYIRFVDDIFGVWTHGEESLFQFHKMVN